MPSTGSHLLGQFQEIDLKRSAEVIVQRIGHLISTEVLKRGDRLPSEWAPVEHLGVGRAQIRDSIKRLEFYGTLETNPQIGAVTPPVAVLLFVATCIAGWKSDETIRYCYPLSLTPWHRSLTCQT